MSARHRWVLAIYLPLRNGQTGRFLGIRHSETGRFLKDCYKDRRFTGLTEVRGVPRGAWFRNETLGVTYRNDGLLWEPVNVDEPNGCRHCDIPQREHAELWSSQPGIGWHQWTEPTDQQRLIRMWWRRYRSVNGRGTNRPGTVPSTRFNRGTS